MLTGRGLPETGILSACPATSEIASFSLTAAWLVIPHVLDDAFIGKQPHDRG
jgi:hypothetical protein